MMRYLSKCGLLATALALSATSVAAAPAEDPPSTRPLSQSLSGVAKESYEAAKLLYSDGDFAGALVKFRAAHDVSRDPRLLWNMAVCEKNLRRYSRAERLVTRYLSEADPVLSPADREEATSLLTAITALVGKVKMDVNEPGATVFVGDDAVGTTPLTELLRVDMGERTFRVTKPGFRDWSTLRTITGGTEEVIAVRLLALPTEGRLRIVVDSGATVRIDGAIVGHGTWEGRLKAGTHGLQIDAPEKRRYQSEIVVTAGQLSTRRVALEAADHTAIPTWAWVASSVVLAAGLGVGGYFLFKPAPTETIPTTPGTMEPGVITLPLLERR